MNRILDALRSAPPGVFNQYAEADPLVDLGDAALRRLANVQSYLEAFAGARFVLIGEAAGYRACRFSGVPFTDEHQLVGPAPLWWAGQERGFARCSRAERPLLREASAGVIWRGLGQRRDIALWNVVPWHPPGRRGSLSNGLPNSAARAAGLTVLRLTLETVWPGARPLAVGRIAEQALRELGLSAPLYVRHPAHGGTATFLAGLLAHCPGRSAQ